MTRLKVGQRKDGVTMLSHLQKTCVFANYELKVEFSHINLFLPCHTVFNVITFSISEMYIFQKELKKATSLLLKNNSESHQVH